jgi:hypothetical protein
MFNAATQELIDVNASRLATLGILFNNDTIKSVINNIDPLFKKAKDKTVALRNALISLVAERNDTSARLFVKNSKQLVEYRDAVLTALNKKSYIPRLLKDIAYADTYKIFID